MDKMEEYFREWILASYRKLSEAYNRGVRERDREAFQEMGGIIGEHAVLGTPEGLRIKGADGIGLAFEQLAKSGKTSIRFELVCLLVVPAHNPIPTKDPNRTVTDVGYAISRFFCQGNPGEVQGGWTDVLKHIGGCPIVP